QAGALGYHDLTGTNGLPYAKIFVVDILKNNMHLSSTICHELMEILLDPAVQMWAQDNNSGTLYAYEACDAVEDFEYTVNGFPMSDFVYPQFFESFRTAGSTQFDYMGKVTSPFQTTPGGYQITMVGGQVNNVFGSESKKLAYHKEDRRMHRSEYRKKLVAKVHK
ncbi:MAG TPA: hypothetical protein VEP90_03640, partial [Methylomirabilota bacterium]|nr:hypothetical protein [Methylomirabilota bacterium]